MSLSAKKSISLSMLAVLGLSLSLLVGCEAETQDGYLGEELTEQEVEQSMRQKRARDIDKDGDGVKLKHDCDDSDPTLRRLVNDRDCDGVVAADDCNDFSPFMGEGTNDENCDGVHDLLMEELADLFDPYTWSFEYSESYCDGDYSGGSERAQDYDCDGIADEGSVVADVNFWLLQYPNTEYNLHQSEMWFQFEMENQDCNPFNPDINTSVFEDADCDGIIDTEDCDRFDPTETLSIDHPLCGRY